MTDFQMWVLVAGFLSPPVLAVIQQTKWDVKVKAVVTFVFAILLGGIASYLHGDLVGRTWVSTTLIILVTAIATYHGFWKPTNVADSIESRTNIGGSTTTAV